MGKVTKADFSFSLRLWLINDHSLLKPWYNEFEIFTVACVGGNF